LDTCLSAFRRRARRSQSQAMTFAENRMPEALDLLKTRRSVKPIELNGPGPAAAELDTLLTVASRVPDHGKLTPWRFIVFDGDARLVAGEAIGRAFRASKPEATADQLEFETK